MNNLQRNRSTLLFCCVIALFVSATAFAQTPKDLAANTLFFASYNKTIDADISKGSGTATTYLAEMSGSGEGLSGTDNNASASALNLLATGSWVRYPAQGNIDTAHGTVSFWVKPRWKQSTFTSVFRLLFNEEDFGDKKKGTTHWAKEMFYITKSENKQILRMRQGNSGINADIAKWAPDTWHHVTVTWQTNKLAFYIDGILAGSQKYVEPPTKPIAIVLGSPFYGHDAQSMFNGLRILNRPLTADEVRNTYLAELKHGIINPNKADATAADNVFQPITLTETKQSSAYLDMEFPVYYVPREIKLTGDLSDPAWAEAKAITGLKLRGSGKLATAQTSIKLLYDNKYLYFGVRADEPDMENLKADFNQRDLAISNDDSFEVVFDTRNKPDTFYHFVANTIGGIYDDRNGDKNWSSYNSIAMGKRGTNGWTLELAIPFSDLNIPAPVFGETWGIRLARERKPAKENSSLPETSAPFFARTDLGKLVFKSNPTIKTQLTASTSITGLNWGLNHIPISIQNTSSKAIKAIVIAKTLSADSAVLDLHQTSIDVPANATATAQLDIPVTSDNVDLASLVVSNDSGTPMWGMQLQPLFKSSSPSLFEIEKSLPSFQGDALFLNNNSSPISQGIKTSVDLLTKDINAFHQNVAAAIANKTIVPDAQWEKMRSVLAGFQVWREKRDFLVWQVDPWQNGSPTDIPDVVPEKLPVLNLEQAGNEREQVALELNGALLNGGRMNMRFAVSDFTKVGVKDSFVSRDQVHIYHAPFVRDGFNRLISDPLIETSANLITLTPGKTEKVWVTFDSRGVAPGDYEGKITLKLMDISQGDRSKWKEIPIHVKVWDFTLPETKDWPLDVFLFNGGLTPVNEIATLRLLHSYHIDWVMTNRFLYMYDMKDDGTKIGARPDKGIPLAQYYDPKLINSQDDFLREAKRLNMKVMFAWNSTRNLDWFKGMVAHLKELGFSYDDFAFQGMSDEFKADRIKDLMPFQRAMHKQDPNVQFFATLTSVPPPAGATLEQLVEPSKYVKIWVNHLPRLWPPGSERSKENIKFFREHHNKLWAYVARTQMVNQPVNDYYRMMPWRAYSLGLDGLSYWTLESSYGDGWDLGDGFDEGMVYRGTDKAPVPSKRFEAFREGLEDIAYMDILKRSIAKVKTKDPKRDFSKEEQLLTTIPRKIEELPKTQAIERWRIDTAEAILSLQGVEGK